jgi:hypothetical protein
VVQPHVTHQLHMPIVIMHSDKETLKVHTQLGQAVPCVPRLIAQVKFFVFQFSVSCYIALFTFKENLCQCDAFCQNNGVLDLMKCSCNCDMNFKGSQCEIKNIE